jgi:hypothetical protein
MFTQSVSISADGLYFEEQTEIAALAYQYFEEAGRPQGRDNEFWLRAEEQLRARHSASSSQPTQAKESAADARVEEAMHLDQ